MQALTAMNRFRIMTRRRRHSHSLLQSKPAARTGVYSLQAAKQVDVLRVVLEYRDMVSLVLHRY